MLFSLSLFPPSSLPVSLSSLTSSSVALLSFMFYVQKALPKISTWLFPLSLSWAYCRPNILVQNYRRLIWAGHIYFLPSGSLLCNESLLGTRNQTLLWWLCLYYQVNVSLVCIKISEQNEEMAVSVGGRKKVMMMIFGTGFCIIKHLIKSLNVYGAQNMHIRIKHIRHNQNYNYISPVPEPTLVTLPRSNALKLSIHLFKKKKSLCCTYTNLWKAWECFGYWSSSCWVMGLQSVSSSGGKWTAAAL